MSIKRKIKEERIRYVDYTNRTINRLVSYSNILTEGYIYLKDNGVTEFSMIDYVNDSDKSKLIDKESFL